MPTEVLAILPVAVLLLVASAFFSGCEAAYFSLSLTERRNLAKSKNPSERVASTLLGNSEHLLMGILFWNLVINISFFSLISRMSLTLEGNNAIDGSGIALLAVGSLLSVILFGEFLPKSIGVLYPMIIAKWAAFPLAIALRATRLITPALEVVTEATRRLLWPGLQSEPYLSTDDLNRVVELSADTDSLIETESQVLQNIIQLKEIHVEEWMRPRTQYWTFTPPLSWEQIGKKMTPSGYMLITNLAGDQLVSYVDLRNLPPRESDVLSRHQRPVIVVPWCATIADTFQSLCSQSRRVAVIVNEYGDTVGVLTWEDIFDAILQFQQGRTHRELARAGIRKMADDRWLTTGMTKTRRLERALGIKIEDADSLTIGGIIQQRLRRLPETGDICEAGGLRLTVLEAGKRGELLIEVTLVPESESPA